MSRYVPYQNAKSEFVEKKSRFIGHICGVNSESEALDFIRKIKLEYYDARHNTYCYKINGTIIRYSDDGEPQGTAGQPMLKVFEKEEVDNFCCVVTRYFGGILLGTGGLSRAYAKSAKDTLTVSGLSELKEYIKTKISCNYAIFDRVKIEIDYFGGKIVESKFEELIELIVLIGEDGIDGLSFQLNEITAGKCQISKLNRVLLPGERISF